MEFFSIICFVLRAKEQLSRYQIPVLMVPMRELLGSVILGLIFCCGDRRVRGKGSVSYIRLLFTSVSSAKELAVHLVGHLVKLKWSCRLLGRLDLMSDTRYCSNVLHHELSPLILSLFEFGLVVNLRYSKPVSAGVAV